MSQSPQPVKNDDIQDIGDAYIIYTEQNTTKQDMFE